MDGIVHTQVIQPDGRILIAGNFQTLRPNGGAAVARRGVARLNFDGTLDSSFINPGIEGTVYALALQADGRIVVGGDFTTVQPDGSGASTRRNILRLNANGTLDSTFDPSANGRVNALLIQPDGAIVLGGAFTSLQPNGGASVARSRLARVTVAGAVDTAFAPTVNQMVMALARQADGQIIAGGHFTHVLQAANEYERFRLARFSASGELDRSFDPRADGQVAAIVIQGDGKILVGGSFSSLKPNGAPEAVFFSHVARLFPDGTIDRTFYPRPNASVFSIAIQDDGKIVLAGRFAQLQIFGVTPYARANLARVNADGSMDEAFNPTPNFDVYSVVVQGDGKLLVGGAFNQFRNQGSSGSAITRNQHARLNRDGSVDSNFDPSSNGRIVDMAVQADGRVVLAGSFSSVGGVTRRYIARVGAGGELDTTFAPEVNGFVTTLAVQADGRIVIGGSFTRVNGVARNFLARLNADGSLDADYDPHPNFNVVALTLRPDGKLLVGGLFTQFNPGGAIDRVVRNRMALLNEDGSIEPVFNPNPNETVQDIALQPDGKVMIAGSFTGIQGTGGGADRFRAFLARLESNGAVDANYAISVSGAGLTGGQGVQAIAVQGNSKLLVGGSFRLAGRTDQVLRERFNLARFHENGLLDDEFAPVVNGPIGAIVVQPDGKILIAGSFSRVGDQTRINIARLNEDGSLDTAFDPNPEGQLGTRVAAIELQPDGGVLFSGSFSVLQPNGGASVFRSQIARVSGSGAFDPSFDAGAGGQAGVQVEAIVVQPDNKVVLAGSFDTLSGSPSSNLARVNADGLADATFSPDPNGPVHAIAIRSGITPVAAPAPNIAWLDQDGQLRAGFDPGRSVQIQGQVFSSAIQADGRILIGGVFTNPGTTATDNLLRLNTDGSIDESFIPAPNGQVNQITVLPDGKILISGGFTAIGSSVHSRIARLNADGTVDETFVDASADGVILRSIILPDGRIIVVGGFSSLRTATDGMIRPNIARLNADGSLDTTFTAATDGTIGGIVRQPDGKLVVVGSFGSVQGTGMTSAVARFGVARFNEDGSLDTTFDPNKDDVWINTEFHSVALQSDGKILVGGFFRTFGTVARSGLVRINADGTLDPTFTPEPNGLVSAIRIQSDGRIVIGGAFSEVAGTARNNMARLLADGSIDPSFNLNTNGRVNEFSFVSDGSIFVVGSFSTVQPTGAIIVGGEFSRIGGLSTNNLALLNSDGTAGSPFQPNPNGAVFALAPQPDGQVFVGGAYTVIGGVTRNRAARISPEGQVDATFNPNVDGTVFAAVVQSDGRIVIGGSFSSVQGTARSNLARLNADGTLDGSFDPAPNGTVRVIALRPDGSMYVGGSFTSIGGSARSRLALLAAGGGADAFDPAPNDTVHAVVLRTDGSLVVAGNFTSIGGQPRNRVASFLATGVLDSAFDPSADGLVSALSIQRDGKLLVGGSFSEIGGRDRASVARFAAPAPAIDTLTISDAFDAITWSRSGAGPEIVSAAFEVSVDGAEWAEVGVAARVGTTATWELGGLALSLENRLFVRARGVVQVSQNSSAGLVEELEAFYPRPVMVSASTAGATVGESFTYGVVTAVQANSFTATGLPPGLSIDASTGIIRGTPSGAGTFTVNIEASSLAGPATSQLVITIDPPGATSNAGRLVALSTRAIVRVDSPLISGIVISGTEPKSVLFRAVGPGLDGFGVTDAIRVPMMRLFDAGGNQLLEARAWGGSQALSDTFARLGEFPLAPDSADSAVLVTLDPGNYTMHVVDGGFRSFGGVALAEVYDASDTTQVGAPRVSAISSRASIGFGGQALIGGLAVTGNSPKRILLRGVGPNLVKDGLVNVLDNPLLEVYDSTNQLVARNDDWETQAGVHASFPVESSSAIQTAAAAVGLPAFDAGSKDSAVLLSLPPGVYTVMIKMTLAFRLGQGMVEIYEVP